MRAKGNRAAMLMGVVMICVLGVFSRVGGAEITPIVSATLNGSTEGVLVPGQPGIFEIEITHPDLWEDALEPIRLELGAGASWTNALKWSVQDASGSEVVWPLAMLPVTSTSIVLDREYVGQVFLLLSPGASLAIPIGTYAMDFALDTRVGAPGGAWMGMAQAIQLEIRVGAEVGELTASEITRKQIVLAQYYALRGDFVAAQAVVDLLLTTQPRSQDALRAKAEILRLSGKVKDALAVSDIAIGVFAEDFPNSPEPPLDILELHSELTVLAAVGLKVTSAALVNGQITIVWEGETGKQYRVESSSDFVTWRVDASGVTAFNWSGSVGPGMRFFRIVVEE
jgi:hypothetical protein